MKAKSKKTNENYVLGINAMRAGDYVGALDLLQRARKEDRKNAELSINLGYVYLMTGHLTESATILTEALKIQPNLHEAVRRLAILLRQHDIPEPEKLNSFGLRTALNYKVFEVQPFVELSIEHCLRQDAWSEIIELASQGEEDAAVVKLIGKKTSTLLQNDLLQEALKLGKNTHPIFEKLLTALRRYILTEISTDRLQSDRALMPLLITLIQQCEQNEYVWNITDDEDETLRGLSIEKDQLLSGDLGASLAFIKTLLFRPFTQTGLSLELDEIRAVKPKALALFLKDITEKFERERVLEQQIKSYGISSDDVSLKVREQYEQSPYPQWNSLHVSKPGSLRDALGTFYDDEKLAFMDEPFDVLIAGCGTGQQAARSASGYGENANLLGIDLSLSSLAYGKRKCEEFGIKNIDFAQADILNLKDLNRQFDIIECIGVLHHMADPFEGWRVLIELLKPGGLMYIGLYSPLARTNIATLRAESNNPGPGCSDNDARAYRTLLMNRKQDQLGYSLRTSPDFYALHEFRDLILHESEQTLGLDEIDSFLQDTRLAFHGFVLNQDNITAFENKFPKDPLPGTLTQWHELEHENPNMFDGMYLMWFSLKE